MRHATRDTRHFGGVGHGGGPDHSYDHGYGDGGGFDFGGGDGGGGL